MSFFDCAMNIFCSSFVVDIPVRWSPLCCDKMSLRRKLRCACCLGRRKTRHHPKIQVQPQRQRWDVWNIFFSLFLLLFNHDCYIGLHTITAVCCLPCEGEARIGSGYFQKTQNGMASWPVQASRGYNTGQGHGPMKMKWENDKQTFFRTCCQMLFPSVVCFASKKSGDPGLLVLVHRHSRQSTGGTCAYSPGRYVDWGLCGWS